MRTRTFFSQGSAGVARVVAGVGAVFFVVTAAATLPACSACGAPPPQGEGEGEGIPIGEGEGEGAAAGEGEGAAGEGEGEGEGGFVGADIADVYAAPDDTFSVILTRVVVTGVIPAVGDDPAGFFVQDNDANGRAVFVALDPSVVGVSRGDVVSGTATARAVVTGQTRVTAFVLASVDDPIDVETLRTNVSGDDIVANIDALESESIELDGTVATVGAPGSAGTAHTAVQFTSAGVATASLNAALRLPDTVVASVGLAAGCTFSLHGNMWRFSSATSVRAQPAAWDDVSVGAVCPTTLLDARAPDRSTVILTFTGRVDANTVFAGAFDLTPAGDIASATVSNGGSTVTLTLATPLTNGNYVVDMDESVLDTFGAPVGPAEASFALCAAPLVRPIITEVAWMGSDTSANDEWIEIENPGDEVICDMSSFTLVGAGTSSANITLPALPLSAGDFFVVEKSAGASGVVLDGLHGSTASAMNLANAGEVLLLCPAATVGDPSTCDVANPSGAAWFAGSNTVPKQTMERVAPDSDGALAASWRNGSPSSPGFQDFAGAGGPATLDTVIASDASTVVLTFSGDVDATTALAASFTIAPSGAVANATAAGPIVTLTTTAPLADGPYSVSVDATVLDTSGAAVGPVSAAFTVCEAAPHLPIISEVAWMGSDTSATDEWIEINNPSTTDPICNLAQFTLVGAGASTSNIALPATLLEPGGVFVVEKDALATGAVLDPAHVFVAAGMNLANNGEVLRLCPVATVADPATCDTANPSGAAWFAGDNTVPKTTMERSAPDVDGALASSWHNGTPRSPGTVPFGQPPPPTTLDSAVAHGDRTVTLTFSAAVDASTVDVSAFILTPLGDVDTVTVSGALITITTVDALPDGDYSVTIDDTIKDTIGASIGPASAPFTVDTSAPSTTVPIISEVAWMGDDTSTSNEWIELFNSDSAPVDLSGFTLIQGTVARPLPDVVLGADAFLVLERVADVPLSSPGGVLFPMAAITNSGQALCVCAVGVTQCGTGCDVANPAGGAWFAGSNTAPKQTMERVSPSSDGSSASSWRDGSPSSPGAAAFVAPECTIATQATDCDDVNPCTTDTCTAAGTCAHAADDSAVPADDGIACTVETCSGGAAVSTPDDGACDDGIGCTHDACAGAAGAPGTGCAFAADDALCAPGDICSVSDDCVPAPATGDVCEAPVDLIAGAGPANGDTTGFVDDVRPSCAGAGAPDVFFHVDVAQTSTLTLSLSGASTDFAVALFEGGCGALRELACVDAAGAGADEALSLHGLDAGSYVIVVDGGANAGAGTNAGAFSLNADVVTGELAAGDVVLDEIMAHPAAPLVQSSAEWIELANPRAFFVSTGGLFFGGNNASSPVRSATGAQLVMAPGGLVVGARSADATANGGLDVQFTFAESLLDTGETQSVTTTSAAVIDAVTYTTANGFPGNVAGAAFSLDPSKLDATLDDAGANWCHATTAPSYSAGNFGTPGETNAPCP